MCLLGSPWKENTVHDSIREEKQRHVRSGEAARGLDTQSVLLRPGWSLEFFRRGALASLSAFPARVHGHDEKHGKTWLGALPWNVSRGI